MPTYSYRCTECGNAFDIQQAFTDDTLTECPACGGKLRKLFSAIGVTFNGSGFYRTDSRGSGGSTGILVVGLVVGRLVVGGSTSGGSSSAAHVRQGSSGIDVRRLRLGGSAPSSVLR